MNQTHILVVDDNEMVTEMMRVLLNRLGYAVTLKTSPGGALKWMRIPGNLPNLIISDVMMPDMSGQEFIQHVRNDPLLAHLPIILLTGNNNMEEKVAGFKAGADDYLVKPVDPTELDLRVKALLARAKAPSVEHIHAEANVITLFSLRGGVGTTSIAVNLAIALAHLWGIEVPLLDFSLRNGHCALMLNIKPKYTVSYLTQWDTPTVEIETLEQLLVRHATGVRLLAAPHSPVEAELITPAVIDRIWPYIRSRYPFIVIDGGSHFVEPTLSALERSHAIILPLAPELASVKAATNTIHIFEKLRYNSAQIMPVINWTFPDNWLPKKNLELALGHRVTGEIPYHRSAFVKAINSGQPTFVADPGSPASLAVADLAYRLSAEDMEGQNRTANGNTPKLLSWVRKLAQAA
jgi:pilus assembly protein CpaE